MYVRMCMYMWLCMYVCIYVCKYMYVSRKFPKVLRNTILLRRLVQPCYTIMEPCRRAILNTYTIIRRAVPSSCFAILLRRCSAAVLLWYYIYATILLYMMQLYIYMQIYVIQYICDYIYATIYMQLHSYIFTTRCRIFTTHKTFTTHMTFTTRWTFET
jgi:hypothetical protein